MKKIGIMLVVIGCIATFVAFAADGRTLGIQDVFERISKIEGFETEPFEDGSMGFPEGLGKAIMAIHPNASPREEIVGLLDRLPKESLAYDNTDEEGRFDRIFVDEVGSKLLFVHVGCRTGDTVAILFQNVDIAKAKEFVTQINEELHSNNH